MTTRDPIVEILEGVIASGERSRAELMLLAYKTGFDRAIVSAMKKANVAGYPLLAGQIGIEEYPPYMVEEMKEPTDVT